MFWNKKSATKEPPKPKVQKLRGPREIPHSVGKLLTAKYKLDPDLLPILRAVVRENANGERSYDCRIFDQAEAEAIKVQIGDYTTLDEYPDLILYEGWYNSKPERVEMEEKKHVDYNTPIFTEDEILQKIQLLSEPGNSVFFYRARGMTAGGPLGRGAIIVEINPDYPQKTDKKYVIYESSVVNMEPAGKKLKWLDSNKPKEIARLIKASHHKRIF